MLDAEDTEWTEDTLDWLVEGLRLIRDFIGIDAYSRFIKEPRLEIENTILKPGVFGETNPGEPMKFSFDNVYGWSPLGGGDKHLVFVRTVVHESVHRLLQRGAGGGNDFVVNDFGEVAGWSQDAATGVWNNPGTGYTKYAREGDREEDLAESVTVYAYLEDPYQDQPLVGLRVSWVEKWRDLVRSTPRPPGRR